MHKYWYRKGLIYERVNEIVDHKTHSLLCTSASISNLLGKVWEKLITIITIVQYNQI